MRMGNFHPNLKFLEVNIWLNVLKGIIHILSKPMLLPLEVEKNVDIPMAIQEPKDLKMSSNDIYMSNTDEIVKRAIAIQFLKL